MRLLMANAIKGSDLTDFQSSVTMYLAAWSKCILATVLRLRSRPSVASIREIVSAIYSSIIGHR